MRTAVRALILSLLTLPAVASDGLRDLYLQAAAVGEKCTGAPLGAAEIDRLAKFAGVADREIGPHLARARAAAATVDCDEPHAEIHVQFFKRVILPEVARASSNT